MTLARMPRYFFVFALVVASCVTARGEQSKDGLDGITKPFADLQLSFVQPGKIRSIRVKEGNLVRAGDVLMKMEDEIELIQLKIQKARGENRLPIDLAHTDLLQKQKDLEKIKTVQEKGAVTLWEVDHTRLAVDAALLSLKIKEFEKMQDMLKADSIVETIKNLTLVSPTEGRVEEIKPKPGESVQALAPVIRLVKTNPLVIDLAVPLDQARELEIGQKALVRFADTTERPGAITKKATVADAAATTLNVSIEVENPQARPAGERVAVMFSPHS